MTTKMVEDYKFVFFNYGIMEINYGKNMRKLHEVLLNMLQGSPKNIYKYIYI